MTDPIIPLDVQDSAALGDAFGRIRHVMQSLLDEGMHPDVVGNALLQAVAALHVAIIDAGSGSAVPHALRTMADEIERRDMQTAGSA